MTLVASTSQKRAIELFLTNGGDKLDAYVRSRKRPLRMNEKITKAQCYKFWNGPVMKSLLADADFKTRLNMERKADAGIENALTKYEITREKILEKLAKIAFAEATDVMSWGPDGVVVKDSTEIGDASAAVSEVSSAGGGDKSPVHMKVKLMDQRQALIDLGREAFGMFSTKVDVKGVVAVAPARFVIEGK